MELLTETEPNTVPIPDGAATFTVWGWKPEHARKFQDAKGDEIRAQIVNLVRNFQVMANDDERMVVNVLRDLGLWGFGRGIVQVFKILNSLEAITEATQAYAVLEGLREFGWAAFQLGITVVITAILVVLFIMKKDAAGLMVILNDTDQDLILEDITSTHGKVVAIFKENPDEEDPKPIIPKRLASIVDPKTKTVALQGSIQAGFFAVRKRDNAWIGPQGALKFRATESFPEGAYLGWIVPLLSGQNSLRVSATYSGSVSQFSDATEVSDKFGGKREDTSTSTANATITGRVNSGSGSEAYYVINLAAE